MLVNWFYIKMDLYSMPTWPNMQKLHIKQKFIHWTTRGRLNNYCNSNDLLGMKRQRIVAGFLHTSTIQAWSAILIFLESHELYMTVHAIEWQIGQHLL